MSKFQLSIKKWLLIFLLLFLIIPLLMTRFVVGIYEHFNPPYKDFELESLDSWMTTHVLDDVGEWDQQNWQKSMIEKAYEKGVALKLVDNNDKVLFSNIKSENQYEVNTNLSGEDMGISNMIQEYPVYLKGQLIGTAYVQDNRVLHVNPSLSTKFYYLVNEWGGGFVWLSLFVIILIVSSKFIKKKMLHPLKEFQKATHSIRHQNFDFYVPYTPIKELNELSNAFLVMQHTLKESLDKQNKMEKEREIFISSIIHDLRTPLFSIRGYLEGIKKGIATTPEKLDKYIDVSYNKANLLNELIDDLYMFTKVNYIDKEPKFADIKLIHFVDGIVQGFYPQALEKDIIFKTNYQIEAVLVIKGDDYLLSRALENIIGNAVRYTPESGNIVVSIDKIDNLSYSIKVEDTGVGIPSYEMTEIFSPLYRGEKSRNRKTGGSGLGLSIAKQIVEKHKGKIQVWSTEGEGTTVEVTLPFENNRIV